LERAEIKQEEIRNLFSYPDIFTSDIQLHFLHFQGGSRQWLHDAVAAWMADSSGSRVFWLRSDPGMGKSAFAASLVHKLQAPDRRAFLAVFFCRFGDQRRLSPEALVRSLAAQCAAHLPEAAAHEHFVNAFKGLRPDVCADIGLLFEKLLKQPLASLAVTATDAPRSVMVLVLDALDEAGDS
jgi:hypothetical protein